MTRSREPGAGAPAAWGLVVPVKGGERAKSRLGAGEGLARAIALDTLTAVAGCRRVREHVIVSRDDAWRPAVAAATRAAAHAGLSVRALAEPDPAAGPDPTAGPDPLNTAIRHGCTELGRVAPEAPAAVLLGDLPALQAPSLAAALDAASGVLARDPAVLRVVVPDADGAGTVLLAARRPDLLRPRFGAGSAHAHEADGAVRLELDLPRLRRDVDTAPDLAAAVRLGVGPRTARARAVPGVSRGRADLPDGARTA